MCKKWKNTALQSGWNELTVKISPTEFQRLAKTFGTISTARNSLLPTIDRNPHQPFLGSLHSSWTLRRPEWPPARPQSWPPARPLRPHGLHCNPPACRCWGTAEVEALKQPKTMWICWWIKIGGETVANLLFFCPLECVFWGAKKRWLWACNNNVVASDSDNFAVSQVYPFSQFLWSLYQLVNIINLWGQKWPCRMEWGNSLSVNLFNNVPTH